MYISANPDFMVCSLLHPFPVSSYPVIMEVEENEYLEVE